MSDLQERLQSALGGTYRIVKELGGGGMSRVFLAEETRLGRQVVVKVLPPETGAAVNVERFEREIQLAARLQHPHIVPLLTAAGSGDLLYYIMPYISGESLRARLSREGELPVSEAAKILREIVDALSYAHRNGVVHRDIKPDNVLLSGYPPPDRGAAGGCHAVVTDFGVAKAVSASSGSSSLTSLGVALGTPAYMAPEQAAADPNVDHRADIYAVGALAYEMLTGRTPFTSPTPQGMLAAHITQAAEPVSRHRPAVSPSLNAVLMRCLEKRPADRWQSAAELLAQLEAAVTPTMGLTPAGTMPTAAMPISSGTEQAIRRSHPARVALLFAAGSAVVLGVVYLLVRQLGLPDWVLAAAALLLVLGLPIMLLTGQIERRRALARAGSGTAAAPAPGLQGWLTWRKAIRGGVLAFAALGAATVAYTAMRLLGVGPVGTLVASGRLNARDQLVVADFASRNADSSLASSVTEAFRIDLAQSPLVRILGTAEVAAALARMQRDPSAPLTAAVAREVAARNGAKAVVAGEIGGLGKGYDISVRILSAADGSELVALRETAADDAGIVAAVDRLSSRVRERIGESLKSIRDGQPLDQVTTASLEALGLYTEGAKLSDAGYQDRAIPLLEKATALDTGFAMAWRKLAVTLMNGRASQDRVVAATTRAYLHRDRLPEVERQLTEAFYHASVDVDEGRQEAAYRRVLAIDPDNTIARHNLALLLNTAGRPVEAESLTAPAVLRSDGSGAQYYPLLLAAQVAQRHDSDVRRTLGAMASLKPMRPTYVMARAVTLEDLGDYAGAERTWLDLALSTRDASVGASAHSALARLDRTRGKLAEAERQTRLAIGISERRGLAGAALAGSGELAAQAIRFRGDTAGALNILETALRQHPLDSILPLDRPRALLATVYAAAGDRARARQSLTAYEAEVPQGIRRGRWEWYEARGWVALAEGKPQDAIAALVQGRHAWSCPGCGAWEEAMAYERAEMPDSALAAYERAAGRGSPWKAFGDAWGLALSLNRLGELYEERGDRAKALAYYGRFVDLWKDADPVLQTSVRDVRGRMAKLAGEAPR